jgi:hypothetical protein
MDFTTFDELHTILEVQGPAAALGLLKAQLRRNKDYNSLFYALLMEKRQQLGINPIPTGPAHEIPEKYHADYENAIRGACHEVGELYLKDGNLSQAWAYYRMLNDPAPVRAALEAVKPEEGDDVQPLVQIAFYEGVHPRKGFDWILQRFGLCSAITTMGSQELPHPLEDKQYCLSRLVQTLYGELRERLLAEITRKEESAEAPLPQGETGVVRKLIETRPWLFEDDFYHIDVSHLSSVVQMSIHLPPGKELDMARELCAYGQRLSGRFKNPSDPPFEDFYPAYDHYLGIISGAEVEEGLQYFREQVEKATPEETGTYPAEVLVNLLLKLNRPTEALAVARKYLAATDNRQLSCPSIADLCQKVKDFQTLAEVAREQGDPIHYLAGLLASRNS